MKPPLPQNSPTRQGVFVASAEADPPLREYSLAQQTFTKPHSSSSSAILQAINRAATDMGGSVDTSVGQVRVSVLDTSIYYDFGIKLKRHS
jgi:hypothetical protein